VSARVAPSNHHLRVTTIAGEDYNPAVNPQQSAINFTGKEPGKRRKGETEDELLPHRFAESSSVSPLFTSRLSSVYVWTRVDPETKEVQA
jgi:hypothetical protein